MSVADGRLRQVLAQVSLRASNVSQNNQSLCQAYSQVNWKDPSVAEIERSSIKMSSKYQYRPILDGSTIRLLEIQAALPEEPLVCHLMVVTLEKYPAYEALSYCWGDATQKVNMSCDGKNIPITINLDDALHRLRKQDVARVLWVDAVCINQEDIEERQQQVKLMASIYSKASTTYVWLGRDDEGHAEIAFDLCMEIAKARARRWSQGGPTSEHRFSIEEFPQYDEEKFRHLPPLFQCPWFSRVWVVQEVGLSRRTILVWGKAKIPWSYFIIVPLLLDGISVLPGGLAGIFKPIQMVYLFGPALNEGFLEVLYRAQLFLATDPRDKIFGLLAHPTACVGPQGKLAADPNYAKPWQQVYQEFAKDWIERRNNLEILSAVIHRVDSGFMDDSFPSWVPRWDTSSGGMLGLFGADYLASGTSPNDILLGGTPEAQLRVRGLRFATVREYSGPLLKSGFQAEQEMNVWSMIRRAISESFYTSSFISPYGQGSDHMDAYILSLSANKHRLNLCGSELDQHLADFQSWWMTLRKNFINLEQAHDISLDMPAIYQDRAVRGRPTDWAFDFNFCCSDRIFFHLDNGYIGVGPEALMDGDVCCILFGARVPFILRQCGPYFKLVGECYVHGIMSGEAIEMRSGSRILEEEFNLC